MNTRYTTVNLDVSQQGSIPSITLSQYDLGVGLGFYIMDGGLPYSEFAETDTVVLSGTKPSGVGFTVPAYYKSGNLCSFRTPQAMTTEAGTVTCEITITKVNNISVSTANFFVEVEASAHAHETVDEDIEDFSLIANQVGEYKAVAVRAAQQAAQSATDAAASAGSAEESMEAAQSAASSAIAAKDDIDEFINDSEAWAKGTRGGTEVPSTDETYHNNAKYYAERSSQDAEAWARGTRGGTAVPQTDEAYQNNAKYYAEQSSEASMAAGSSASEAAASAQEAAATLAGAVKPAAIDTEFSTSTAYAVGDTVVYQGGLYEFTSAHAAGAWNASHVQAISVMDEVSDLKGDLSEIEPGLSDAEKEALINCFSKVGWEKPTDGANCIALLKSIWYQYPMILVTVSNDAIYTIDTLDTVKPFLTVTYYENAQSEGEVVEQDDYQLSGDIRSGQTKLTVSYNNIQKEVTIDVIQCDTSIKSSLSLYKERGIYFNSASGTPIVTLTNTAGSCVYCRSSGSVSIAKAYNVTDTIYAIPIPSNKSGYIVNTNHSNVFVRTMLGRYTDGKLVGIAGGGPEQRQYKKITGDNTGNYYGIIVLTCSENQSSVVESLLGDISVAYI